MKKFTAEDVDVHSDHDPQATYYDSDEADQRIDQLERALKSCSALLILDIREREKFLHAAKEAVREADKALTV